MSSEALFTSSASIAQRIERLLRGAGSSIDCALYRLGNAGLAQGLSDAAHRGVRVRVVLDRGKLREGMSHRELLREDSLACRVSSGRTGAKSKMHHKFAVVDRKLVLTGSYNWSEDSEKDNYENLVVLHESGLVEAFIREFESLWKQAGEGNGNPSIQI